MSRPLIFMRDVTKTYLSGDRNVEVLHRTTLDVAAGEFVAVMGASGSGKSTLLNILGLLDQFDAGVYELDGVPVGQMSESHAARQRNQLLGFVFQAFHLLPFKTAAENVELPLFYRGVARATRRERALHALDRMGLGKRAHHRPAELSGGERQRVAIARALVGEPKLVLADEPTGALDAKNSQHIMELLAEVRRTGVTVVMVTHDSASAAHADRVLRMRDGILQA